MTHETVVERRTVLAVAAAACSLTLAVGVTAAALLGYVGPGRSPGATTAPALDHSTSRVVLVPVQPAPAEGATGAGDGEPIDLLRVSARHEEHGEHSGRKERRHHEHDDDDD
jgi:hypothetical protein